MGGLFACGCIMAPSIYSDARLNKLRQWWIAHQYFTCCPAVKCTIETLIHHTYLARYLRGLVENDSNSLESPQESTRISRGLVPEAMHIAKALDDLYCGRLLPCFRPNKTLLPC
jgi:hypothetical protein